MAEVVNSKFIKQDGKVWDLFDLPEGFVIKGDLDLSNRGLEKLPDLSKVKVGGDFDCFANNLTSLEGAPKEVGGDFDCFANNLTSLEGAPEKVSGGFDCSDNQLTSLEGAPKEVAGGFNCFSNQLTSLEGAPKEVGGAFYCSRNQLTSLEGAPKEVEGLFYCDREIAKKYGLNDKFTFDDLKASELYNKETKQGMIDKKAQELRYKLLREVAKENVSPEKGVVNPKRSDADKEVIKAAMEQMRGNIGK